MRKAYPHLMARHNLFRKGSLTVGDRAMDTAHLNHMEQRLRMAYLKAGANQKDTLNPRVLHTPRVHHIQ